MYYSLSLSLYFSDSQTFPMRGPLRKIWWSAKHKILIVIWSFGPLQLISRATSGPRSRLWESLLYLLLNVSLLDDLLDRNSFAKKKLFFILAISPRVRHCLFWVKRVQPLSSFFAFSRWHKTKLCKKNKIVRKTFIWVSISSTFYARIFHTKVLRAAFL